MCFCRRDRQAQLGCPHYTIEMASGIRLESACSRHQLFVPSCRGGERLFRVKVSNGRNNIGFTLAYLGTWRAAPSANARACCVTVSATEASPTTNQSSNIEASRRYIVRKYQPLVRCRHLLSCIWFRRSRSRIERPFEPSGFHMSTRLQVFAHDTFDSAIQPWCLARQFKP